MMGRQQAVCGTPVLMLLYMSNCSRGQVLASHVAQDGIDLTSDISFEATDDLRLGHSFARTTAHILLGWLMVAQAHEDDAIEGSVGLAVAPSIESMAVVLPEEAGTGFTPHMAANAASDLSRSGLPPAVTRRVAAVSGPIPKSSTNAGAVSAVRRNSSSFTPSISEVSWP